MATIPVSVLLGWLHGIDYNTDNHCCWNSLISSRCQSQQMPSFLQRETEQEANTDAQTDMLEATGLHKGKGKTQFEWLQTVCFCLSCARPVVEVEAVVW